MSFDEVSNTFRERQIKEVQEVARHVLWEHTEVLVADKRDGAGEATLEVVRGRDVTQQVPAAHGRVGALILVTPAADSP